MWHWVYSKLSSLCRRIASEGNESLWCVAGITRLEKKRLHDKSRVFCSRVWVRNQNLRTGGLWIDRLQQRSAKCSVMDVSSRASRVELGCWQRVNKLTWANLLLDMTKNVDTMSWEWFTELCSSKEFFRPSHVSTIHPCNSTALHLKMFFFLRKLTSHKHDNVELFFDGYDDM